MKKIIGIGLALFMIASSTACSSEDTKEIEDMEITTSLNADERFLGAAYINANKDGVIITLENGFGRNLRAVDIQAIQYNKDGKKVKGTSHILAEYLLDGQEYVNFFPIRLDDNISHIEVSIAINESLDHEDTGQLYNNYIGKLCGINRKFGSVSYTITNNSPQININDTEFILVYYKGTVPVYCIMLTVGPMKSKSSHSGNDHIPPVVSVKDGITDLDFDEVKVIVNRAR